MKHVNKLFHACVFVGQDVAPALASAFDGGKYTLSYIPHIDKVITAADNCGQLAADVILNHLGHMGIPVILRSDNPGRLKDYCIKIMISYLVKYILRRFRFCFCIGTDHLLRVKMICLGDGFAALLFGNCVDGTDVYQSADFLLHTHVCHVFGPLDVNLVNQGINPGSD